MSCFLVVFDARGGEFRIVWYKCPLGIKGELRALVVKGHGEIYKTHFWPIHKL